MVKVSLYGLVPGASGEAVPFLANTFQSEGHKLNTLSSCFIDSLAVKDLEILVDDGSEEDQQEIQKLTEMRPVACNEYSKIMDFVDKADQATMANLSHNHKKHWSTAEMVWVVTMLLTVNVKKLFESASGKVIECGKEWRDYLIDCLFNHTLGDKIDHPPSEPDKKSRLPQCRSCCVLGQKTSPHNMEMSNLWANL